MAVKVYYHIYCKEHTEGILKDQINKIIFSGLYKRVDSILCCLTGQPDYIEVCRSIVLKSGSKFQIQDEGPNDRTFERFTLKRMRESVKEDDKVLYIHTKGITKPFHSNVKDWKNLMEFMLFVEHERCLGLLDFYDIVGVNWKDDEFVEAHYSGNMWWASGKHILTLPVEICAGYCDPEFWIAKNNPKQFCIWDTGSHDHYQAEYPYGRFIDALPSSSA